MNLVVIKDKVIIDKATIGKIIIDKTTMDKGNIYKVVIIIYNVVKIT